MSRYLVTSGSYFTPLSFEELIHPIERLDQAHGAAADLYDELSMETEALRNYISDNPGDAKAKKLYDDYSQQLSSLQTGLWQHGFNANTRRDLSAARAGYKSNIVRLQEAIKTRQERSKEYWDMRHKNPDLIASADPGLGGIDNYLNDSNYGMDWFSYSGDQFAKEVQADAFARAGEMLRVLDVTKDPRLAGWLTRITKEGFTSGEVEAASRAVRAFYSGDATAFDSLDPASSILANVLTSHLESTGARDKVSPDEFNRLIRYGEHGLSGAIGKTDMKDFADKAWEFAMDDLKSQREWSRKLTYERLKKQAEGGDELSIKQDDVKTDSVTGTNYDKARKNLDRELGPNRDTLILTKDGTEVYNKVGAAGLVYSDDLRRDAFGQLGFDIGRDASPGIDALTPKSKLLHGEIIRDGVVYETTYNPNAEYNGVKGVVLIREKGSRDRERIAPALTAYYHKARNQYDKTLKYYRDNEPDVYKRAKSLDPDAQAKMYERDGISFGTPIYQYEQAVLQNPQNSPHSIRTRVTLAEDGATDSGKYAEKFAAMLSNNFPYTGKDKPGLSRRQLRLAKDTSSDISLQYLHEINSHGLPSQKTIKNVEDVFNFNDKAQITNISSIELEENGINRGYVTVGVRGKEVKQIAVSVDMFDNGALKSEFARAKEMLARCTTPQQRQAVLETESMRIKTILGLIQNTQSQSGTNKEGND